MSANNAVTELSCANCGKQLADRYCAHCGQDSHVTLSVKHFIEEFVEGMFHFDSTFWRTFLPLLFKPGLITAQYLAGKRKSYAPPLRSYLVVSLIYFLIASCVDMPSAHIVYTGGKEMRSEDCTQIAANATWLRRLVPDVEGSCTRVFNDHGHSFNNAVRGTLPKVMFAVLPLVALVQFWLNRRQRSLYVENLVFVLHFQSFFFLAGAIALLLIASMSALFRTIGWPTQGVSEALDFLLYAWSACYLYIANRSTNRMSAFKAVRSVVIVAMAYSVFWGIGVSIAAMIEFIRA